MEGIKEEASGPKLDCVDTLVFFVNGKKISIQNPPQDQTLTQFLRNDLGLMGTKISCGEGACGACTVTLAKPGKDGTIVHSAINSCFVKICSLHGTSITTVEGLVSKEGQLHPVQERIHKGHGVQCGYCTPGMVMSMHSRLRDEACPVVDVEDVVKAIDGNLCRCTGYRPIVEAFSTFCTKEGEAFESQTFDKSKLKDYCPKRDDPELPEELLTGDYKGQFLGLVDPSKGTKWFRPTTLSELAQVQKNHATFRRFMGGTGGYKRDFNYNHPVTVQLDDIQDLMNFEETAHAWYFGSGVTLTDMAKIFGQISAEPISETRTESELSIASAFSKALSTLASPQIRNVARIGGSVFYCHPCSDLLPLYIACGAWLELTSGGGCRSIVHIDEKFCSETSKTIQSGNDVVVKVVLPKPKSDEKVAAAFFRKSRRKTFDLSICNAAFVAKIAGDKISSVDVVFGGSDHALTNAASDGPAVAKNTIKALTGFELSTANVDNLSNAIRDAILSDVVVNNVTVGNFDVLRKTLAVTFTTDFLRNIAAGNLIQKSEKFAEKKFHQIFKKVGEDQPVYDLVERPVAHMWSDELSRGRAVFVDDMKPIKDELVAVLVQSKVAHAEIISVDYSEALKVPGVEFVVSAEDLTPEQNLWGISWIQDEEVFASKKVLHHGQVIAALLCSDVKAGRMAAQKVVVQYKELPFILSVREERRKGTDLDSIESFLGEFKVKRIQKESDIGLESSKTISGTVAIGRQEHAYMETHAAVVIPLGEKDEFVCYYTTQEPTTVQVNMAKVLGVPRHKIIVKAKRIGGAFGGKERLITSLIAAVGAKKSGRPVRCVFSRREDMSLTGHRHEILLDYTVEVDPESGKIRSSNFTAYSNAGHSVDLSIPWINLLMFRLDGGYTLHNFDARGRALRTNVVSSTAMRGFGGPEGQIIIEEIIDRIAFELKKEPNSIKEVNLTRDGDQLQHGSQIIEDCTLDRCWKECLERSKYDQKLKAVQEFNSKNKRLKRGLAITPIKFACSFFAGPLFQACAVIRVYTDGTVLLSHGGIEMGQGLHTKMIQIASRILEIDPAKIHINDTSTELVANTTPTGGSAGTDLNGVAVMNACKEIMSRLAPVKAQIPNGTWEDWVNAANGQRINLNAMGYYNSSKVDFDFFSLTGRSFDYLVYGAGCTEVEVDCETGDISVRTADLVMDVGKSVNPAIDVGQIEGAFMQGLGYVTNEQLINSTENGKILTDNFGTYKVPTVRDIPNELSVTLLDRDDVTQSSEVYSSKGIGEPPLVLCAAVTSAVRMALTSFRNDQGLTEWFDLSFPLTADKVRGFAADSTVEAARQTIKKEGESWAIEV